MAANAPSIAASFQRLSGRARRARSWGRKALPGFFDVAPGRSLLPGFARDSRDRPKPVKSPRNTRTTRRPLPYAGLSCKQTPLRVG